MTIIIRYFKHTNKVMYISKENYIQLYNLGALMDSKQLAPQEKAQNNSRRLHCSQQSMISIVTICSSRFHRLLHRKSALGRVTDGAPRPASLPPSLQINATGRRHGLILRRAHRTPTQPIGVSKTNS